MRTRTWQAAVTAVIGTALFLVTGAPALAEAGSSRPVEKSLEELTLQSEGQIPPAVLEAGRQGVEELKRAGVVEKALKKGDRIPPFTLNDAHGNPVSSQDLLARGPVVMVFYRGAWCPFCNLYLRSIQQHVGAIEKRGASLMALSIEPQERSLTVEEKLSLTYTVLSDPDLSVSREFGVVYEVPKIVNDAVLSLGFNLAEYNGTAKAELPLTVTYVVDRDGTITWAYLDPDYKKRAEPADIIEALDALAPPKSD